MSAMEMSKPMAEQGAVDSADPGFKWGTAIKAMASDPMAPKIVQEVDRAGCMYPPFLCVMDPNTIKYARERSYLWIFENGIEENMYAPKVCCGCISIQACCCCCKCPGEDNIAKIYFDHPPFMGPKTGFATEKDINWCCHIPKVFEGIPCDCCDIVFRPCFGARKKMPPSGVILF